MGTADITTSKLHWNIVLSTLQAKYMCLNLKNFLLSVPLDRYKYMHIPIGMFPALIVAQHDLLHKVVKGYIYLKMQRAVLVLPQAGILANTLLRNDSCLTDTTNANKCRDCRNTRNMAHIVHPGG